MKGHQQMVFVSHEPNIPALGDAERVFFVESQGATGSVPKNGDVDAMRPTIERYCDGGKEAFRRRAERYGYEVKHDDD